MAKFVGLDIGTHTIKGAVFTGKASSPRLVDFFIQEIPTIESAESANADELGTPESLEQVLERVIEERDLGEAEVAVALDTTDCVLRELTVPFTKDEQIAKTVQFEAEGHFPGLDFDDVTLDYVKIDEADGRSRLAVWVAPNAKIEKRLQTLKAQGIDPVALSVDVAALVNAFSASPLFDKERTTLVVDLGRTTTRFVLFEQGQLRKARALRIETRALDPNRALPSGETGTAQENGDQPGVAVEVVGDGDLSALFDEKTIEKRFREIEEALQKLDPASGEGKGSAGDAKENAERTGASKSDEPSAGESSFSNDDFVAPIAILSDEDYDLVREESDDDGVPLLPMAPPAGELDTGDGESDGAGASQSASTSSRAYPGAGAAAERAFDYRKYLEQVSLEIQRFVVGLRLERPVELICVTGGMALDPEAARFLERELDVETVPLDFGNAFTSDLDEKTHSLVGGLGAVAVGLAARAAGRDAVGIDFRKGRFRYEHRFEKLRIPALVAALLLTFVSVQEAVHAMREWKEETNRVVFYTENTREAFKAFFGEYPKPGIPPMADARGRQRNWAGLGRDARYISVVEAVQNIGEILDKAKDKNYGFSLQDLDLKLQARLPVRAGGGAAQPGPGPGGVGGARGRAVTLRPPSASNLVIETNDPRFSASIDPLFRNDAQSKIFEAQIQRTPGRREGDPYKLTIKLNVKDSKLRELQ